MESWAGPFSPCSAPNGGGLGALLSRGFALHSAERWQPQRSLSPDLLPVSLCSPRPHAGARAPYPAVLARPRRADTPDSKMASVGKHGKPAGPVRLEAGAGPGAHRRPGRGGSCGAPAFAAGLRRHSPDAHRTLCKGPALPDLSLLSGRTSGLWQGGRGQPGNAPVGLGTRRLGTPSLSSPLLAKE